MVSLAATSQNPQRHTKNRLMVEWWGSTDILGILTQLGLAVVPALASFFSPQPRGRCNGDDASYGGIEPIRGVVAKPSTGSDVEFGEDCPQMPFNCASAAALVRSVNTPKISPLGRRSADTSGQKENPGLRRTDAGRGV